GKSGRILELNLTDPEETGDSKIVPVDGEPDALEQQSDAGGRQAEIGAPTCDLFWREMGEEQRWAAGSQASALGGADTTRQQAHVPLEPEAGVATPAAFPRAEFGQEVRIVRVRIDVPPVERQQVRDTADTGPASADLPAGKSPAVCSWTDGFAAAALLAGLWCSVPPLTLALGRLRRP